MLSQLRRPAPPPRRGQASALHRWALHPLGALLNWVHEARATLILMGVILFLAIFLGLVTAAAPVLSIYLLVLVAAIAAFVWFLRQLAPGAPWWIKAMFFVLFGQLIFNYGFANTIFFVGGAPIPLTELLMVSALFACAYRTWLAKERIRAPLWVWLLFGWVMFNLAWHLPGGLQRYGVGAARDAMPTVEMLFAIPGFFVATVCLQEGERGLRWIRSVMLSLAIAVALYGPLYPFSASIQSVSPQWPSIQQSVPMFGHFQTWPAMGLLSIIGLALWRWQAGPKAQVGFWGRCLGAAILLSGMMVFLVSQARIAYLFVGLCLPVLLFIGGQARQVLRMVVALFIGLSVLLAIQLSGLEVKGRIGQLSASGVYEHVLTLTGSVADADSDSEFSGAAGGINQRKQWRQYSLGLWAQDWESRALGIGFGVILTDLTTGGTAGQTLVVREPHNSYVTTLTRSGLAGLGVMLVLHAAVLRACIRGYRLTYRSRRTPAAYFLLVLFYELYCLLNAWGEPHFEVAHFAVSSYFLYGTVFALYDHLFAKQPAVPAQSPVHVPWVQGARP